MPADTQQQTPATQKTILESLKDIITGQQALTRIDINIANVKEVRNNLITTGVVLLVIWLLFTIISASVQKAIYSE